MASDKIIGKTIGDVLASKTKKPKPRKIWHGSPITKCDLCEGEIKDAFIDGGTTQMCWAIMCSMCHMKHGVGLGTGRGQRYHLDPATKEFVKVAG